MKSAVLLAVLGFLVCSEAFPKPGQHRIQNKLGCADGESYCNLYITQGGKFGTTDVFLSLSDRPDSDRTCWLIEKHPTAKDLFAMRQCNTKLYIHPDYDGRNWVRHNWAELKEERTWWKFTPAARDTFIISSNYGCDEYGEGRWPCGKELQFFKGSVQVGAWWLAVADSKKFDTNWKFI